MRNLDGDKLRYKGTTALGFEIQFVAKLGYHNTAIIQNHKGTVKAIQEREIYLHAAGNQADAQDGIEYLKRLAINCERMQ